MDYTRINKRVFVWADSKSGSDCKNYIVTVKMKFRQLGLNQYSDISTRFSQNNFSSDTNDKLTAEYVAEWDILINRQTGRHGMSQ